MAVRGGVARALLALSLLACGGALSGPPPNVGTGASRKPSPIVEGTQPADLCPKPADGDDSAVERVRLAREANEAGCPKVALDALG